MSEELFYENHDFKLTLVGPGQMHNNYKKKETNANGQFIIVRHC